MTVTRTKPARDTVLYDGECGFCRRRVANLRTVDLRHALSRDRLLEEMVVVDTSGRARGGAAAMRYLSRRLPLMWPLALLLHIPGSLPAWNWLYRLVARNRMRLSGGCHDGTCRL